VDEMKNSFDFGAVSSRMVPFLGLGAPLILDRIGGPQPRRLDPVNDIPSQFESIATARISVASQLSLLPPERREIVRGETNWLPAKLGTGQGCAINPGNEIVVDLSTADGAPVYRRDRRVPSQHKKGFPF